MTSGSGTVHFHFVCLVILYIFIVGSVDSHLLVGRHVNGNARLEDEDYVTEDIQRLSRSPHHFHASQGEDYQCSQTKKHNDGEGRPNIDEVCPKQKQDEIRRSVIALTCRSPHLKTVKFKLPGPNYDLVPSVARVRRCSGHCQHPKSCLPSKKSIVRVPVYQIDKTGNDPTICVDFELEEHEECRCGCTIQERHCTKNQIYEEAKCACICNNQEEKESCLESAYTDSNSKYWDDTTCQCHCVPLDCPRLMVWVPTLCRCAKVSDDGENALY